MALLPLGCGRKTTIEVVLYTSVDQPFAEPIVRDFEKQTGIHVRLVTDTEASKSVGLAERLRAEKSNPQADVWWGNEPFHTINLAEEGLLQPYDSPGAGQIMAMYKDPEHRWAGNGLRARVIAAGGSIRGSAGLHLTDLADPKLKEKIAMARPTAGTTGGHVAALFVLWGDERASAFFRSLRANQVKLLGGNGPVAEAVARKQAELGLTDNDDVASASRESGGNLEMVLPDQDGFGTLMLPTTIGLVSGSRQPDAAKKLVDYLLSPEVEQKMEAANFTAWSVRQSGEVKAMQVDYLAVARAMPEAVRKASRILEGRE